MVRARPDPERPITGGPVGGHFDEGNSEQESLDRPPFPYCDAGGPSPGPDLKWLWIERIPVLGRPSQSRGPAATCDLGDHSDGWE